MYPHPPHFLLFSESQPGSAAPLAATGGRWRFRLESVDGSTQFAASDEEDGLVEERLELLAVVRGLEALDQPSRVTLVTASKYVSRGLRFGLEHWRENRWCWEQYGRMVPVPHADLWRRVDRATRIHEVRCRTLRWDPPEALPGIRGAVRERGLAVASRSWPSLRDLVLRTGDLWRSWLSLLGVRRQLACYG